MTDHLELANSLSSRSPRTLGRYQKVCDAASEANYSLDRAAEVAGVPWSMVLSWLKDKRFVDMWGAQRIRLTEQVFGTSVELALGKKVKDEDGKVVAELPPDGAMLRHLSNALDPRFQKRTTVEHTGSVDVHINAALKEMTDEEKRAELRRLLGPEPMTLEGEIVGD